jgi:hypothetical protein
MPFHQPSDGCYSIQDKAGCDCRPSQKNDFASNKGYARSNGCQGQVIFVQALKKLASGSIIKSLQVVCASLLTHPSDLLMTIRCFSGFSPAAFIAERVFPVCMAK